MVDGLAYGAGGRLSSRRRPLALACLCTVLFLTFLDNTVVSVALASIQSDLHGGVSALQWVVGAYALTFASFMLAFGMMGDKFGRKKILTFTLLTLLCFLLVVLTRMQSVVVVRDGQCGGEVGVLSTE